MDLRPYQARAVESVTAHWHAGARRVCLVIPTGGGKTHTAVTLTRSAPAPDHRPARILWLAHRAELLDQASARLRAVGADVGILSPARPPDPWASVQVASLDTLVSRGLRPPADLVVLDECHHAAADTYAAVLADYADARHLGLTATPQRRDGRPLGDYYDALVVGAQYSELLSADPPALVRCRVRRPAEYLGSDLARSPLDEWREIAGGRLTFAFAPTVEQAHQWAADFRAAGIASEAIEGGTSASDRSAMLARFRAGTTRVLWNVYVLTEGVDVPHAECCLIARGCGHAGTYLQIAGRVLRPAPGKADALVLDMSGVSHLHGLPTADREYSLTGRSIRVVGESLKNCPNCGACIPAAQPECPDCGYVWQRAERRAPKIWDLALQWAADEAGGIENVDDAAKRREWDRLIGRFAAGFARREYEGLFGEAPPAEWIAELDAGARMRELRKLVRTAETKGYKSGWVGFRFKSLFRRWPTASELAAARAGDP